MGNVCTCCQWGRGNADSNGGMPKKQDKKDAWFEQDSVPLVSARHGLDDIGSDDADGTLKRTVLIRSPRPTSTSTSDFGEGSNHQRTSRHLQQQHELDERQYHIGRVKAESVASSSFSRHPSRRSNHADERPRSHSKHHHHRSSRQVDEGIDDRLQHPRTIRSTSLEVQDSTRELRSSSAASTISPRATSQSQDAASFADDEVESLDSFHGSTRSHRSSSASSSPKASSRGGSPHKKPRYGRKHYRANANRK
jgi:hypothetical protein